MPYQTWEFAAIGSATIDCWPCAFSKMARRALAVAAFEKMVARKHIASFDWSAPTATSNSGAAAADR
jgi:hypothetical protein